MSSTPESPPACQLGPGPPDRALPRICINTSSIVVDLWLAGRTNPSCSVGSGTCRSPLQMLQFCHVSEWPSPRPSLDGLPGPPDRKAPTCSCCHSEVILPDVPSSAHYLPWLHIIHRLFMCPAGPGRPPIVLFCSEMLQLTSDWPHYHCRLGILFADLNIHPSALACSCTPAAPFYADFPCSLGDPLGFKDPPPGSPVTEHTRRWLNMLAVTACFLRSMCPALSSATPSQPPARACSTLCTTDTATTLDSMNGPAASITSILLGSPVVSPLLLPRPRVFFWVFPRCLASLVLPTRSAMMRFTFLVCMSLPPLDLLPVLLLPRLPTVTMKTKKKQISTRKAWTNEVPISRFSHCPARVSCYGDGGAAHLRPSLSHLSSSTSPPFVRPRPAPQTGGRGQCALRYG
jgi:hypothetical protein